MSEYTMMDETDHISSLSIDWIYRNGNLVIYLGENWRCDWNDKVHTCQSWLVLDFFFESLVFISFSNEKKNQYQYDESSMLHKLIETIIFWAVRVFFFLSNKILKDSDKSYAAVQFD